MKHAFAAQVSLFFEARNFGFARGIATSSSHILSLRSSHRSRRPSASCHVGGPMPTRRPKTQISFVCSAVIRSLYMYVLQTPRFPGACNLTHGHLQIFLCLDILVVADHSQVARIPPIPSDKSTLSNVRELQGHSAASRCDASEYYS
jgi:hypothetical protein